MYHYTVQGSMNADATQGGVVVPHTPQTPAKRFFRPSLEVPTLPAPLCTGEVAHSGMACFLRARQWYPL